MRMEDIRDIHFLEYQDLQILWDQEDHMNHQVVGRKSWAMSQMYESLRFSIQGGIVS